jgi:hypothetical protein
MKRHGCVLFAYIYLRGSSLLCLVETGEGWYLQQKAPKNVDLAQGLPLSPPACSVICRDGISPGAVPTLSYEMQYQAKGVAADWAFQDSYANQACKIPRTTLKNPKSAERTSDSIATNKAFLSEACLCIH